MRVLRLSPALNRKAGAPGRFVFRALALVNLFEGLLGLELSTQTMWAFSHHRAMFGQEPYLSLTIYGRLALGIVFSGFLIGSAPFLWRAIRIGIRVTLVVLSVEVIYSLAFTMVQMWAASRYPAMNHVLSGSTGIGDMAIGVQLITAYPIVACVLAYFAWKSSPGMTYNQAPRIG
jgi:hypothetical protein